ncbi:hypothetical protein SALBM135S_00796 [Streptomyces alboniger]
MFSSYIMMPTCTTPPGSGICIDPPQGWFGPFACAGGLQGACSDTASPLSPTAQTVREPLPAWTTPDTLAVYPSVKLTVPVAVLAPKAKL